ITVDFQYQSASPLASPLLQFNRIVAGLMNLFGGLNSPFKPQVLVG
ncbi:MAG: hypothetical protein JNM56_16820, partial [Planctomycetia bacterium]|nr:hypothetical protein [Planctomycetia bacterium]